MLDTSSMSQVQRLVYRAWREATASISPSIGELLERIEASQENGETTRLELGLRPLLDKRCDLTVQAVHVPFDAVQMYYAHTYCELGKYAYVSSDPEEYPIIVRGIADAVVQGRVVETLWKTRSGRLLRHKTRVPEVCGYIGDDCIHLSLHWIASRLVREEVRYEPYA